ncbi:ParM/StbA family protein [Alicyclobacillus suci]|uniref:ParM/StbA family protein n=1 Tax=Alicyclobacillus suci TaxID=2816080 RepID=UPI001A90A493|nr:ParM/StbA family protein [Alicyclobacillus suci]
MKIAIDLGNRFVKAINEKGDRVMLRSVVAHGQHRSVFSLSRKQPASEESIQVTVKGQDYLVGKMAERFGLLPEYVFGRDRFDGEAAEVLIWTVLSMLVTDNEAVDLTLDYPYSQFHTVKGKLSSRLRGKSETIGRYKSEPVTVSIRSVSEYPQSLVAAYALAPSMPELFDTEKDGYIAVVDIGGDTTDVVVLETFGGDMIIHDEISGTIAHGTRDLTQVIRRSLETQTGDIMDTDLADRVLHHGSMYYGGKDWDLSCEVEQAKKDLATVLKSCISDLWGTRQNRVRTAIFVGGGAMILESELQGFHPNQAIAHDAQWKNAEGCLLADSNKSETVRQRESGRESVQHKNAETRDQSVEKENNQPNSASNTLIASSSEPNKQEQQKTAALANDETPLSTEPPREAKNIDTGSEVDTSARVPGRFREGASAWR